MRLYLYKLNRYLSAQISGKNTCYMPVSKSVEDFQNFQLHKNERTRSALNRFECLSYYRDVVFVVCGSGQHQSKHWKEMDISVWHHKSIVALFLPAQVTSHFQFCFYLNKSFLQLLSVFFLNFIWFLSKFDWNCQQYTIVVVKTSLFLVVQLSHNFSASLLLLCVIYKCDVSAFIIH